MKLIAMVLWVGFFGACTKSPSAPAELTTAAAPAAPAAPELPADAKIVVDRFAGCVHFAGEEPYSPERAKELADAQKELRCDQVAADRKAIEAKYKDDAVVLKAFVDAEEGL